MELFVGVLGASSYVYAEAAERQDLTNWIDLNVGMLESFGGVPAILVPDNLKSGVTGPCRYEADVNRTYEEMATHYGTAVIPARAYKPRDKAKVEVSVLLAQRWVLAALRNRTFFSLAELNAAIRERVEAINGKVMRRMGVSRRDLFEKYDRPALRPLPKVRYELAVWKTCTVNIDYHIELEHNLYSVPSPLVGQKVEARATRRCVEIYLRQSRVASHRRQEGRGRVSTVPEHMPVSHRMHAEWTPSRLIAWGQKAGPATGHVVETILRSRPHPEQGYRACLGLMRLGRNLGHERLEAACERARRVGGESDRTGKNILASGMDRQALPGLGADPHPSPSREHPRRRQLRPDGGSAVLTNATVEKMHALRLGALAEAFEAQLTRPEFAELEFAERVGLLVDAEWKAREQKSQERRLKAAALRHQACLEDIDWTLPRGLDRSVVLSLATCAFIRDRRNLLITGKTGVGKSYLACAFAERACRSGLTAYYVRAPRLYHTTWPSRGPTAPTGGSCRN